MLSLPRNEPKSAPAGPTPGQGEDILRPPVLVIAGDAHRQTLVSDYLTSVGYGVLSVLDIEGIGQTLKSQRPYALVIDDQLADGSGAQELHALRSRIRASMPVVLFSINAEGRLGFSLFSDEAAVHTPSMSRLGDAIRHPHKSSGKEVRAVLVVDDEPALSELLARTLLNKGFQVIKAFDGRRGLELAANCHPDVIVLDLSMPEYDGVEVLEKLRSNPASSSIPVLIHTGMVLNEEERQRLAGHAYSITSKLDREGLLADLQRLDELPAQRVEI